MSRIITQQAVEAFMAGHNFNKSNTEVQAWNDGLVTMRLHGNTIATKTRSGSIMLSAAGWETSTTKERLNGILDALNMPRVYTKNHVLHDWHGRPWTDSDVLCSAN
tara:strand:+ start:603 stop:920 length:318 start_codon:yes stop_codon:yes gene_type:complete